jgi:hypothetical protein
MRYISILSLSVLCVATAHAQITDSTSLSQIEFARLSQRDPNPLGTKALAIHPEQWKHAESEHIYHFVDSFVATPVSVEAEFHYRVVVKELQREQSTAASDPKSPIYVFQKPEHWRDSNPPDTSSPGPAASSRKGASSSFAIRRTNSVTTRSVTKSLISLSIVIIRTESRPGWMEGSPNLFRRARMRVTSGRVTTWRSSTPARSRRTTDPVGDPDGDAASAFEPSRDVL